MTNLESCIPDTKLSPLVEGKWSFSTSTEHSIWLLLDGELTAVKYNVHYVTYKTLPFCLLRADAIAKFISVVANSAIEILERRDRFCPQQLQATVSNQLQQLAASIQKPGLTLLKFKSKHAGNGDLQELETA
uniref:Uncharacterized protein n=1 Tax=Chenopodium quinoa TaxID=63459 RepID=A0A803LHD1_CHEQI